MKLKPKRRKQYILNGASQEGTQQDGTKCVIMKGMTVTRLTKRVFRDDLYFLEPTGEIVKISSSIIDRYFTELGRR